MNIIIAFILFLHGAIHLTGYIKSRNPAKVKGLSANISKQGGLAWLACTVLFIAAGSLLVLQFSQWWIAGALAVALSQALIIANWKAAKFGTIPNILILVAVAAGCADANFYGSYQSDASDAVAKASEVREKITVNTRDLDSLPLPVKRYLIKAGVSGTAVPTAVRIEFEGEMRSRTLDWFSFSSEQYNSIADPCRLFFMRGKIFGLPVSGYHPFRNGSAEMNVKLLSLISVANNSGREMTQSEIVTYFNDLCLFVPAALADKRIAWGKSNDHSAEAYFTAFAITVKATLYFDNEGMLVNFVSDDRYDLSSGKIERVIFSTPVANYKRLNGILIPTYGETIWHYPDGDFIYGKFNLTKIEYDPVKQN
ncbi:MAG: hypothetical protein K1X85_02025 [Ignavibacteria bacterium]|nr:hypothetical protein [Ignavibacteria bacterium]